MYEERKLWYDLRYKGLKGRNKWLKIEFKIGF